MYKLQMCLPYHSQTHNKSVNKVMKYFSVVLKSLIWCMINMRLVGLNNKSETFTIMGYCIQLRNDIIIIIIH